MPLAAAHRRRATARPAWDRLLGDAAVGRRAVPRRARATLPFVHAPRAGVPQRRVAGPTWALLPSAAGVIDPLLSTGFPLTLLGIMRLLDMLETHVARAGARRGARALTSGRRSTSWTRPNGSSRALYATMDDPPLFKRLSLLYFAAASFSEAARRLGRPEAGARVPALRASDVRPGAARRARRSAAQVACGDGASGALRARIDRAIEPFDTAGLLDRSRRDWYPVLASDLVSSAAKLEASAEEVNRLLERCGLATTM